MCGIGGAISFQGPVFTSRESLVAFGEPMKYRGPDAEGYHEQQHGDAWVQCVHKRLSIIDLSEGGNQPMWSPSGHSLIVFNGEIYNYRELRQEPAQQGHSFRTQSDTETLLVGYEHWGMDRLLDKVNGMFALALFDQRTQTTYLARDPFGKKPLYYYQAGGKLIFSSDIRSFQTLNLSLQLDTHSLGYFFSELSSPRLGSIWQEIKKVPEGHFFTFSKQGITQHRYWDLRFTGQANPSREEAIDTTDQLFTEAVKRRLVADVNVAAQLSGGIDSSLLVAKMASLSEGPVSTYSVGFEEAEYSELPWARQVAEQYGTQHTEFILQPTDIQLAENLVLEYGEPFADHSQLPTYAICRDIAEKEKVVCGGDGGDELFAGYYIYYFVNKLSKVKHLKALLPLIQGLAKVYNPYRVDFLKRLLVAANQPHFELLHRGYGFSTTQLGQLFPEHPTLVQAGPAEHQAVWEQYSNHTDHLLAQFMSTSLHTRLVNDYLVKVDRASMYASLEMRSPFLDKELAQYAASLSPQLLFEPHGNKSILKAVAERYLPHDLIHRNKQGFAVPIGDWFRGPMRKHWEEVVLQGKQKLLPLNYIFLQQYFEEHVQQKREASHQLWSMFVFHLWAQKFAS
ncbi:MAG TPA: asparagine synthase (glutamine-hydrolyzing) [Cytophagales bacterium]|nr:asparagine synthase (glutamine-hydrolyzing) [Cytophagales bacterium]